MENQNNMSEQNTQLIGQNPSDQFVQTTKKPKVNYWMISTFGLLLTVVALSVVLVLKIKITSPLSIDGSKSASDSFENNNVSQLLAKSPSGKYEIRFAEMLANNGLALKNNQGFQDLVSVPIQSAGLGNQGITKENISWNKDESVVAITYIPEQNSKTAKLLISPTTWDPGTSPDAHTVDLGSGAFYGVSVDSAFPPVFSTDGKYIAVQTDLIHQISIYDFQGNRIESLMTKYADTPLFSPEMYQLENGKYSPFLEYKWNVAGDGILYRFLGTEQYYEVKMASLSWKTYINLTFNYSIKYSDIYEVPEQTTKQISQLGKDTNICIIEKSTGVCKVVINATDTTKDVGDMGGSGQPSETKDVIIGGVQAKEAFFDNTLTGTVNRMIVSFKRGNIYYQISAENESKDFSEIDQILSTFKFLP